MQMPEVCGQLNITPVYDSYINLIPTMWALTCCCNSLLSSGKAFHKILEILAAKMFSHSASRALVRLGIDVWVIRPGLQTTLHFIPKVFFVWLTSGQATQHQSRFFAYPNLGSKDRIYLILFIWTIGWTKQTLWRHHFGVWKLLEFLQAKQPVDQWWK